MWWLCSHRCQTLTALELLSLFGEDWHGLAFLAEGRRVGEPHGCVMLKTSTM